VAKVEMGTGLVNQSGAQLGDIIKAVDEVAAIVSEISAAAQEQSSGVDQVGRAIAQMDEVTQRNAALVEQSAAASETMSQQASELKNLVLQFKCHQTEGSTNVSRSAGQSHTDTKRSKATGTYGRHDRADNPALSMSPSTRPSDHDMEEF